MTVTQTAKTVNSITVTVSGMNDGDRQTYISYDSETYHTLADAKVNGYITDYYVANVDNNNGDITITFNDTYISDYKVWSIGVVLSFNGAAYNEIILPVVLGFEFDHTTEKYTENEIDVTVDDMRKINQFGRQCYFANGNQDPELGWYYLDNVHTGDYIYKYYFSTPVTNLRIASRAFRFDSMLVYGNFDVEAELLSIENQLNASDSFKAEYFNNVKQAINEFYLSKSN